VDLLCDLLAAVGELLERPGGLELSLRARTPRPAPGLGRQPPSFLDRRGQQRAGLLGQLEHLGVGLPAAPADRTRDPTHPAADRPRAIADRGALDLDHRSELATLAGQRPHAV
jgi:hypothetical protein